MSRKKFCLRVPALITALGITLLSTSVHAEGNTYLGVGVGQAKVGSWCDDVVGQCDDSGSAFKLYGGYDLSKNASVEVFYANLGKVTLTDVSLGSPLTGEAKVQGAGAAFVGKWPVSDSFDVFARLGIARMQTKINLTYQGSNGNGKGSDFNPVFGVGARWAFLDALSLRVEWERYSKVGGVPVTANGVTVDSGDADVDVFGASLEFRF